MYRPFTSLPPGMARLFPNRWDLLALLLVIAFLAFLAQTGREVLAPLSILQTQPIRLDPAYLPEYAGRTALRMLIALGVSLLFTFIYAPLAAKNPLLEKILVPLLDILQSVPVLGFISITLLFFLSLAPGKVLGAEYAAIFAIFTSQAWNMTFSFYQSLRNVPPELKEAARSFHLSPWMQFWRLEVPFALPQLIWNMIISVSGGWFFVVAAEAIEVGNTSFPLPGIGSFIAAAIEHRDYGAVGWAILAMALLLLLFDQLLFRPLLVWAERFQFHDDTDFPHQRSWVLSMLRHSRLSAIFSPLGRFLLSINTSAASQQSPSIRKPKHHLLGYLFLGILSLIPLYLILSFSGDVAVSVSLSDLQSLLISGVATLLRVFLLVLLASLIWVPLGIAIGLNRKLASRIQLLVQFLAAFPANLLFPLVVSAILAFHLNHDIWLSPLMILGAQWYILFNVIAGASNLPSELRHIGTNLHVHGWLWWRKIALPAVFPYYLTGAITASGGAWNASIVAEYVKWGKTTLIAHGLGSYIAQAVAAGDQNHVFLGIATMCVIVVMINRLFWRPLYAYAARKFRL